MTIDQRRSALGALRDELHDEVQFLRHKAELASQENRPEVNGLMVHWQVRQGQLNALDDAIEAIEHEHEEAHNDSRNQLTPHILIAAAALYLLIMIPVLYALFGGH